MTHGRAPLIYHLCDSCLQSCLLAKTISEHGIETSLGKKLMELFVAEEVGLQRANPTCIYQLYDEIHELKNREEAMWKQWAHIDWLKECDQNTKYFHCRANE